ncbi:hypothetical protein [Motiliproteus coralliicola]|nr:hypothetical protein [Motiliproteus coralliicola]
MEYDKSKFKSMDVSFGYTGIKLFDPSELDKAQLGYSVHPNGEPLTGMEQGDWQESWVVIGHITDCGDPIFVDISTDDLVVFTATHGRGFWVAELISSSYYSFLAVMDKFLKLSQDRSFPVELENNPMTRAEYDEFVSFVSDTAKISDTFFWELLVSDEESGIGPEI